MPCTLHGSRMQLQPPIVNKFMSRPVSHRHPKAPVSPSMVETYSDTSARPLDIEELRQMFEKQMEKSAGNGGGNGRGRTPGGGGGSGGNGEDLRLKFLDSAQHKALVDKWMLRERHLITLRGQLFNPILAHMHTHQLQALRSLREYRPSVFVLDTGVEQRIGALCKKNGEVVAIAGVEVTKRSLHTLLDQSVFAMMREKVESPVQEELRVTRVLAAPNVLDKGVADAASVKRKMVEALIRYSSGYEIPIDLTDARRNGDLVASSAFTVA